MDNILIRQAIKSDLPAIRELMLELIDSVDSAEGFDIDKIPENCHNLLGNADSHILVAESNGSIVGVINFIFRKTLLHSGGSGLIDEIVVSKAYRGRGIGKRLMDAAVEICRQSGCCELEVSTEITNTRARKFYESFGFEETGVMLEKDLT